MSDRTNQFRAGELISLDDALRALPQSAPPASVWPQLAAELVAQQSAVAKRPRQRYWRVPAALAAGVAFVFAATALLRTPVPQHAEDPAATKIAAPASSVDHATTATNANAANNNAEDLIALQTRSRALERWLHDTNEASAPQSAQDLAASAEIEDMIGLVDVQLATPETTAALPLWQRRVALLEDLTTVRYSANLKQFQSGLATTGSAAEGTGALPATWSN
jgi:hypothetical protein